MPGPDQLSAEQIRDVVATFRETIRRHQSAINRLNVYPVPDGDTGTNMARTLDAVVAEVDGRVAKLGLSFETVCGGISHGALMGARGNSGVILSQVLRGLAATFAPSDASGVGAPRLADGLRAASKSAYEAVLKPIEGTILTVVRESADAAAAHATTGGDLASVLRAAREAGGDALRRTPEMLPVLKQAGVVDAGGAGYLLLLDSFLHVVTGEALPDPDESAGPDLATLESVTHRSSDDGVDVSELRYEVMFLLDLEDTQHREFMEAWGRIGDSIVVVGGEGLYNCHIHTNDIGAAIEAPLELGGRPRAIRVTDLFEEVADEHAKREAELGVEAGDVIHPARAGHPGYAGQHSSSLPPVTCAVVAVASGDGIAELFGQLGVHGVVSGGQSLNPSTAELLDAVERMNANQIVLLPNNKNIIPVANQVGELTKKEVRVVPSCSMPEALASLVLYDPEASAEHNAREMSAAAASVATGEITQAVRDTDSDAGPITTGDWIGIVRGDGIVAIGGTWRAATTQLLDHLISPDREILTVLAGTDATAEMTAELSAWMAEHHPDIAVEVHHGGQPLYPYLFGVE
ncbi:MAG: DAK2 domain-containing protein [Actinomycetota bacterium]